MQGIGVGGAWLGALLTSLVVDVALAAPLGESGVAALLPAGELVGDGSTSANLHFLALNPSGAPVLGLKLKVTASAGKAGEPVELGGGLYRIPYVAPAVRSLTPVTVEVRARVSERESYDAKGLVQVQPGASAAVEVRANPDRIVLSQDASATISFQFPGTEADVPQATDVLVRSSSGEVSDVVALGGGRFTARYTPPQVNYPHLAILTVVDRRNPSGVGGQVAIPLLGKVEYPVTTTPGASVILRIGDREFGPTTASGTGQASVSIVVPPGLRDATMLSVVNGSATESPLDLRVPEVRRLQLFPAQPGVPSDSRAVVPIRAVVYDPSGKPDVDAKLNVTATAGRLSRPVHLGGGVYEVLYTPPDGRVQMAATIQATLPGGTKQTDDLELSLVPAMSAALVLTAEPTRLAEDGTGLRVFARLTSVDGAGLADRSLRVKVAGAQVKGEVQDLKGGDYRIDLTADQGTDVDVHVTALSQPSGNALRRVLLFPEDPTLPADGISTASILVVTADEFGYPVGDVPVSLNVTGGGGLPSSVTTDARGVAQVYYTVGSTPGLVSVEASARGRKGATSLLLGAPDLDLSLPYSGSEADVRAATMWKGMQAGLRVPREGATKPTAAASVASGVLKSLVATAEPAVVAPGGSVKVKVRAVDDAGRGLSGVALDFFATGGARFGPVREVGGGEYESVLTAPADAVDEIKVSVLNADGVTAVLRLAVAGGAGADTGSPWGDGAAAAAPGASEVPVETPPTTGVLTVKEKPKRGEYPWLRLRGGVVMSTYSYSQRPAGDAGSLLTDDIAWGGGDGGAAIPIGGEFVARLHVPKVPYIGMVASFRGTRYAVASEVFSEDAVDTLFAIKVDLLGQVPIPVGSAQLQVGARVGFRYDDFITFRGCTDPGCVVTYEPLALPGLDLGVELGAQFWKMYVLVAATGGFAYGSVPYAVGTEVNVGFQVHKHVFVDAGFGWQVRNAELTGAESGVVRGKLTDQQFSGSLGVGFSM